MWPIFQNAVARSRGAMLGWGLALGLLGMFMLSFFEILADQKESLERLLASYPPEMMAFFGDTTAMFTPEGFLGVEFFSFMPIVLGIYAVLAGSGLLAADEESGTLDLLLAHPVSRTALFFGRGLAFLTTLLGILGAAWLGLVIGARVYDVDLTATSLLRPFLSLLGELLLFGAFALLLSMFVPSRRLAAMLSGLALMTSYFITSLARINEDLEQAAKFSPLNYYQSGDAITQLNLEWLLGLLVVALVFTLLAWWRFERRDIRVAGEGSWRWPWQQFRTYERKSGLQPR